MKYKNNARIFFRFKSNSDFILVFVEKNLKNYYVIILKNLRTRLKHGDFNQGITNSKIKFNIFIKTYCLSPLVFPTFCDNHIPHQNPYEMFFCKNRFRK